MKHQESAVFPFDEKRHCRRILAIAFPFASSSISILANRRSGLNWASRDNARPEHALTRKDRKHLTVRPLGEKSAWFTHLESLKKSGANAEAPATEIVQANAASHYVSPRHVWSECETCDANKF